MGAGRKTETVPWQERIQRNPSVNCSVTARNLRINDLGGVILGCTRYTMKECLSNQIFVSRVCFTTAYSSSNPNQDRNTAAGEMKDRAGYRTADEKRDKDSLADEASGTIAASAEKARKLSGDAQEKMEDKMDSTKEKAGEWKEKAKDSAGSVKDKTMDAAGSMKDKTMDAMESGKEKGVDMKEKTKDVAGTMKDKAKGGADNATESASNLGEKAKGTVSNAGEKAKETVKNVWEATKDTTQKIKETVIGKAEDISSSDEDEAVSDLRKRAGGYDRKETRDL